MRRGGRGFGHGCGSGHGRGGRFRDDGDESGRRRRMFDSGELRLVLLKLIADEPRHGYDLISQVEELTSGAYAPSPGVIYPTLTMLDDMGQLAVQQREGARTLFAVTADGQAELHANREEIEALIASLAALGEEPQRPASAPVRRPMGKLRHVSVTRSGRPHG